MGDAPGVRGPSVVVAGLLVFYFNRTVEYFTPAVHADHRSTQALPLTVFTAMTDAARRGFRWWNWGGTWESQTGVYRFKRKWGAEDRHYYYHTQLNNTDFLRCTPSEILDAYPNFFVLPFSALDGR